MRAATANKPAILYCVTNRRNSKRYVGVTVKLLSARWAAHVHAANNNIVPGSALHKAIRKHGPGAFTVEVVATYPSHGDALAAERATIKADKPAYNCTAGGDGACGYKHTAESIAKMSAAKKGKRGTHWTGRRHSQESKRKMSRALTGKPGFWKGKRLPAHVADAARRRAFARLDSWREYAKQGPAATSRKVLCVEMGTTYPSIKAAGRALGIQSSSINEVCKGRGPRKRAGGFHFRYAEAG